MTTFNIKIPPSGKKTITFDPGVPVYNIVIAPLSGNKEINASVSYERSSGTLLVVFAETGV